MRMDLGRDPQKVDEMKASCPHCGTYGPVETFLADAEAKQICAAVYALPGDLPKLVWSYLGLWRKPGATRPMSWTRVGRIISGLRDLINEPETQWKAQRVVPNNPKYWAEAIQIVLDRDANGKLDRPLDGHNYLRAIAYEIAEKAWHAGNVRRESEAQHRPAQPRPRQGREDDYRAIPLGEGLKDWRQRLNAPKE